LSIFFAIVAHAIKDVASRHQDYKFLFGSDSTTPYMVNTDRTNKSLRCISYRWLTLLERTREVQGYRSSGVDFITLFGGRSCFDPNPHATTDDLA
jgi:hypothetical protein